MVHHRRLLFLIIIGGLVVGDGCGRNSGPGEATSDMAAQGRAESSVEVDQLIRARRLLQLGDHDAAADAAYEALLKEPDRADALLLAGEIEAARGSHDRSIELARSIDTESRLGSRAVELHSQQLVKLHQPSAAADVLLRALELTPDMLPWRRAAWSLLNRVGRREAASLQADLICQSGRATRQELHSLMRRTESYPFALQEGESPLRHFEPGLGMARWYFSQQEFDRAIAELKPVFEMGFEQPEAAALYGRLLAETQSFESFAEWYSRCDEPTRDVGDYWAAMGTFFLDQRQTEAAARALLEAVYRNPTERVSTQRLSKVFAALERRDDSEQFRYRGIQLAKSQRAADDFMAMPDDRQAGQELTQLLLDLGRPLETIGWTLSSLRNTDVARRATLDQQRIALLGNPEALTMPAEDSLLAIQRSEFDIQPAIDQLLKSESSEQATIEPSIAESIILARPTLVNVARDVGIDFQWYQDLKINLESIPIHESLGGGIAVLDYDLDGWPDIYLAQGSGQPPTTACTRSNALLRNVNREFTDVTIAANAGDRNYSSGLAAGDVNQDGFPDLYLGSLGRNRLLINNGDGTYRDATALMNSSEDRFTASLAIGDINGDSLPDLFEGNYIEMEGGFVLPEIGPGGREVLPSPLLHYADSDRWFENEGDGSFSSHVIGIDVTTPGTALGIIIADFDSDHRNEVFVSNDVRPNHLLVHVGDNHLKNMADARGVANGFHGTANGCMGIATGDFDRNGTLDMQVANYIKESANLYMQAEGGGFTDQAVRYGIDSITWPMVGFGTKAVDFDRNGWLDFAVTNGHIFDLRIAGHAFQMPPQLMMGTGSRFKPVDVEDRSGYWDDVYLGRSMATIDYNRNGAIDLLVGHLDKPVALLDNQTSTEGAWIQFELTGTRTERDAIGARVVVTAGGESFTQWVTAGDGYLCTDEPVMDFGLGQQENVERVEVFWPSGVTQTLAGASPGHRYLIIENDPELFRRW